MLKALIIFIKNPVAGQVKTRLAKDIGDLKALKVYNNLLAHTRKVAEDFDGEKHLFYDSHINTQDEWAGDIFHKSLQEKGDLGERMKGAFDLLEAKHEKLVIIGSDCPNISTKLINEAFDKLTVADIVIGPTYDGGYYLLGARKAHPWLFENIDWSTEKVFEQTVNKIQKRQLLFTQLEKLSDLDYQTDLVKFPEFQ